MPPHNSRKGARRVNDVTREDLKEWKDELKGHFEAKLDELIQPVLSEGRLFIQEEEGE